MIPTYPWSRMPRLARRRLQAVEAAGTASVAARESRQACRDQVKKPTQASMVRTIMRVGVKTHSMENGMDQGLQMVNIPRILLRMIANR